MPERDKAYCLAAEAMTERDYLRMYHDTPYREEVLARIELIEKGTCPDSLKTFEECSASVCDCNWQGGLPWLN